MRLFKGLDNNPAYLVTKVYQHNKVLYASWILEVDWWFFVRYKPLTINTTYKKAWKSIQKYDAE